MKNCFRFSALMWSISFQAGNVSRKLERPAFLLDRYHLLENLCKGAMGLAASSPLGAKEWGEEQVARIDRGKVEKVIAECGIRGGEKEDQPLNQLARYLEKRKGQLDYASAQEGGLPIGSGAVEGGHCHVIQARLKLPGTWWLRESPAPKIARKGGAGHETDAQEAQPSFQSQEPALSLPKGGPGCPQR